MQHEALLIGMGQLGAVFAGFLAIVLAFVQRDHRLDPGDALRTRSILHPSFLIILGSTLPLILHANGFGEAQSWQWSAIAGLAFATILGVINMRFNLRMTAEERIQAGRFQILLGWLLTLPGYALTAWVAAGFGDGGLYIASLGLALLVASWNFMTLAGKRWL